MIKFPKQSKPRIAIDFDMVVCNKDQNLIEDAQESLIELHRKWYVIIFTARTDHKQVKQWLQEHDCRFDEITNIKPNNIAFWVDDHGIRFENWKQTLEDIKRLDSEYQCMKSLTNSKKR